jgi:hypothetical protein
MPETRRQEIAQQREQKRLPSQVHRSQELGLQHFQDEPQPISASDDTNVLAW